MIVPLWKKEKIVKINVKHKQQKYFAFSGTGGNLFNFPESNMLCIQERPIKFSLPKVLNFVNEIKLSYFRIDKEMKKPSLEYTIAPKEK